MCRALNDVGTMQPSCWSQMGVRIDRGDGATMSLHAAGIDWPLAPYELVKTMRASILALGPLLARCGEARVSLPGGCAIGLRPVDQHVKGLRGDGRGDRPRAWLHQRQGAGCRAPRSCFDVVTVTGTENLMMAATLAEGTTVLENAAREPEVVDLARCLTAMGARIIGAGTDRIAIEGVGALHGARHAIMPDRIETGTFLAAVAATRRRRDGRARRSRTSLEAVLGKLREAGATIDVGARHRSASGARVRCAAIELRTAPHPGFPTDMQAQFMALATRAEGTARDHRDDLREPHDARAGARSGWAPTSRSKATRRWSTGWPSSPVPT